VARPTKRRCVECVPCPCTFGPLGARTRDLDTLVLPLAELEALRLLHIEGVTQAEAGRRLGVSASTVSRMAARAHRTVTEALILGKAVCVEGGQRAQTAEAGAGPGTRQNALKERV